MRLRLAPVMAALALTLAGGWNLVGVAHACSCAGFGGPVEAALQAAQDANVAFTGTVVGTRPAAPGPDDFGPMVAYAFDVHRASDEVDGTIEVHALDDGGGASCGFTFGMGEAWFVTASLADGRLQTGLCNGNQRLADLDPGDVERLEAVLPQTPAADGAAAPGGWQVPWGLIGGATALLATLAVTVFAFRGESRR